METLKKWRNCFSWTFFGAHLYWNF